MGKFELPGSEADDILWEKIGKMELPEDFKGKLLDVIHEAPDVGSNMEDYLAKNEIHQIRGYLRGFNEKWIDGY